jgi:hypothetical protein
MVVKRFTSPLGSARPPGPASRETLESAGSDFRVSNPRSEALKGFEHSVEVINVDWR